MTTNHPFQDHNTTVHLFQDHKAIDGIEEQKNMVLIPLTKLAVCQVNNPSHLIPASCWCNTEGAELS